MRRLTWTSVHMVVHDGGILQVERTTYTADGDGCHSTTEGVLFALVPLDQKAVIGPFTDEEVARVLAETGTRGGSHMT